MAKSSPAGARARPGGRSVALYEVRLTREAKEHYSRLSEQYRDRVDRAITALQRDPGPDGLYKYVVPEPFDGTCYIIAEPFVIFYLVYEKERRVDVTAIRFLMM